MASKRPIAVSVILAVGLGSVSLVRADAASDVCAALANARTALYSMLSAKDKSTQDALNAKVQEASSKLESALAGMTGADAKAAAEFKALWDQFKTTRDTEIIPAIYNGNADAAKKIADSIQSERLSKMWSVMSCR